MGWFTDAQKKQLVGEKISEMLQKTEALTRHLLGMGWDGSPKKKKREGDAPPPPKQRRTIADGQPLWRRTKQILLRKMKTNFGRIMPTSRFIPFPISYLQLCLVTLLLVKSFDIMGYTSVGFSMGPRAKAEEARQRQEEARQGQAHLDTVTCCLWLDGRWLSLRRRPPYGIRARKKKGCKWQYHNEGMYVRLLDVQRPHARMCRTMFAHYAGPENRHTLDAAFTEMNLVRQIQLSRKHIRMYMRRKLRMFLSADLHLIHELYVGPDTRAHYCPWCADPAGWCDLARECDGVYYDPDHCIANILGDFLDRLYTSCKDPYGFACRVNKLLSQQSRGRWQPGAGLSWATAKAILGWPDKDIGRMANIADGAVRFGCPIPPHLLKEFVGELCEFAYCTAQKEPVDPEYYRLVADGLLRKWKLCFPEVGVPAPLHIAVRHFPVWAQHVHLHTLRTEGTEQGNQCDQHKQDASAGLVSSFQGCCPQDEINAAGADGDVEGAAQKEAQAPFEDLALVNDDRDNAYDAGLLQRMNAVTRLLNLFKQRVTRARMKAQATGTRPVVARFTQHTGLSDMLGWDIGLLTAWVHRLPGFLARRLLE